MRETVIAVLVLLFFLTDPEDVPNCGTWIQSAMLHNVVHVNIFHLAVNILAFSTIYRPERKGRLMMLVLSLAIGTLAYSAATRQTVGMSDAIYASIGMLTPSFSSPWWRKRETVLFLGLTVACLAVTWISATTHIVSFAGGVAVARLRSYIGRISDDFRRAKGRS